MDTKFPVIIMLSLGVGVLIFQLSGAGALLAHSGNPNYQSGDVLQGQSENASIENNESYGGQVRADSDSNIVGVILGSIPRMLGLLAIPGALGSEIQLLTPAPWYVAQPVGMFFNIFVYIGGFQIATGRIYE